MTLPARQRWKRLRGDLADGQEILNAADKLDAERSFTKSCDRRMRGTQLKTVRD